MDPKSLSELKKSVQEKFPETTQLLSRMYNTSSSFCVMYDYVKTASRLTGLRPYVLQELEGLDIDDILVHTDNKKLYRSDIYNELANFYLNKKQLPTSRELLDALINYYFIEAGKAPKHMDIKKFRKMLVKMGFVWKCVPNTNKFVVVEKPSVIYERYEYLKNIKQYRNEKKTIVYIGETDEVSPISSNTYWVFAVTEQGVGCSKLITQDTSLMKWFQSDFSLQVPPGSVVVIQTSKQNDEVIAKMPTEDSFRSELEEWLKLHNIPYHVDLPKVHLYDLVRKFTNVEKLYRVDVLLKSLGYEVLRLPKCINGLSLADVVKKEINENSGMNLTLGDAIIKWADLDTTPERVIVVKEFDIILEEVSKEALKEFELVIEDTEKKLLDIDKQIDNCIDDLFTMPHQANNLDDEDSDLPSDSGSESD